MALNFVVRYQWLNLLIIVFASLNLILVSKHFYKIVSLQEKIEKTNKNHLSQIYMWNVITVLGSILQIFSGILMIFDDNNSHTMTQYMAGLAAFFSLCSLGRYLEFYSQYDSFYFTIRKAGSKIMRYLVAIMPLFFAFMLFGKVYLWRSPYFRTMTDTFITLFSFLNNDNMLEIFTNLQETSDLIAVMYIVVYFSLFVFIITNVIMIAVVTSFEEQVGDTRESHNYISENELTSNLRREQSDVIFETKDSKNRNLWAHIWRVIITHIFNRHFISRNSR